MWRRPENQRWNRKVLNEMIGDPWNPAPQPKDKPALVRATLWNVKSTIKTRKVVRHASGKRKCFHQNAEHDSRKLWTMKLHRQQLRAQLTPMSRHQNRQRVASRQVQAASEDDNMEVLAEGSALEAEDDASAKRQKVLTGMPILHESDVDVNVDAHKMLVMAAMPDDREQWSQRVVGWDKKYYEAKSGNLLDTQPV